MNQWIAIWLKLTHSTGDFGYHRCSNILFICECDTKIFCAPCKLHPPPYPKTFHTALRCYRVV